MGKSCDFRKRGKKGSRGYYEMVPARRKTQVHCCAVGQVERSCGFLYTFGVRCWVSLMNCWIWIRSGWKKEEEEEEENNVHRSVGIEEVGLGFFEGKIV
ncbi:hypothetical protein KY285_025887 [Solanum tuberosum]|nr:hypothetical protein KY285_025887 [Solanum tuberosum]